MKVGGRAVAPVHTRPLGPCSSACCRLALAQAHDAVAADRPWKQLKGFRFEFVR